MTKDWKITDRHCGTGTALASRLPAEIIDAHAHLYSTRQCTGSTGGLVAAGPDVVDREVWQTQLGRLLGAERLASGLFIPMPTLGEPAQANRWLLDQLRSPADDRALVLAWPDMDQEKLAEWLQRPGVAGIKPYHVFGPGQNTFNLPVEAYCPEWMWRLCADVGALITLHLVRRQALADPENLQAVQTLCERYPEVKLVLAHAGRGFHAPHSVRACAELAHLDNLWFDFSAVCEAEPILAVLDAFGPSRLLWGSDFPVSQKRGRCVTVGEDFSWICPERIDEPATSPHCETWPVGLESLRAFFSAADRFGLNDEDAALVFRDNARRLLGLDEASEDGVQGLYRHAKKRMPGGTQLLSKRPEMLAPDQWPAYFSEARGCRVRDTDGRQYIDFSYNGIGACLLGFRDPDVTRAVRRRINLGSMCTQNPPEEVLLADRLCELHPWAEQVRYARSGGEVAVIAVRIARATTGKDHVAVCGYHGWHDWYLAANLGDDDALKGHLLPGLDPDGVPSQLRGTTHTFAYGDLEGFRRVLDRSGDELACVVMEPARHQRPEPGFLETIREETRRRGILLIFDEISIGFRLCVGGAHLLLGVDPDLAIFAKALGNGHPMAAVIGTSEAMEGAHRSFISSTYWTEGVGPAAALAVLEKMERVNLPRHLAWAGESVKSIWREEAETAALAVTIDGDFPCMAHLSFDHEQSDALRTLYTQQMLRRGFLAGAGYYPSFAHQERDMVLFREAVRATFGDLAEAIAGHTVMDLLSGPVAHSGFRRLVR